LIQIKKASILISLSLLIIFQACRPGEDVLVSFEGGKVQRKNLRELYDIEDAPRNEKTLSIATQTAILEQMGIQEIIEKESILSGFFDRSDIKDLMYYTEKEMIVNLYLKNFFQEKKDSESLEMLNIQFALLYNNDDSAIDKIKTEISALKDNDKIEEYISGITQEDGRKCVGGILEPQCNNCTAQDQITSLFKEGITKNDSNFYVSKDGNKAFIYRIFDRDKVKSKNLDEFLTKKFKNLREKAIAYTNKNNSEDDKQKAAYYLEDSPRLEEKAKMTASHYLRGFQNRVIPEELIRLQNEKSFTINEELKGGNITLLENTETVVLKTPTESYTVKQLNEDFSRVFPNQKDTAGIPEKLNFLQNIMLPTKLIADSSEGEKVRNSDTYKTAFAYMKRSIAFNIQKSESEKEVPPISDAQIKEIYEAGKQFQFSEPSPKNPNERVAIPFEKVKDKIKSELTTKNAESVFQKKILDLKTKYKMEIHVDKLKEGSI
jgi:hypothetical protein